MLIVEADREAVICPFYSVYIRLGRLRDEYVCLFNSSRDYKHGLLQFKSSYVAYGGGTYASSSGSLASSLMFLGISASGSTSYSSPYMS